MRRSRQIRSALPGVNSPYAILRSGAAVAFFLACLAVVISAGAARAGYVHATVEFNPAELQAGPGFGTTGTSYRLPGCATLNRPGAPAVPFRPVLLAIPEGEVVLDIQVRTGEEIALSGRAEPGLGSGPGEALPWDRRSEFPGRSWDAGQSGHMRGQGVQGMILWPVAWDPATHELRLRPRFDIEITTGPATPGPEEWRSRRTDGRGDSAFREMLRTTALNPGEVAAARVERRLRPLDNGSTPFSPRFRPSVDGSPVDMVIITSAELAPILEPLAQWKTERGITAVVRSVEWIRDNYPNGVDLGDTIRRFISDAASRWGTEYVLLAGDVDIIPARYGKTLYFGGEDIPADMYYQCLDGSWNADGDAYFGEGYVSSTVTGDGCDLYPDVWLGRAAVSDSATAAVLVDKVLTYEKTPPAGYLTRELMMAEVLFPQHYTPGDTIIYDGALIGEDALSRLPAWFSKVRRYENYPAYAGALPEEKSSIVSEINLGYGVVQHVGHGYINTMAVGIGGLALDNTDVTAFTNHEKLALLYSINCTSAAIDYNCIGEKWLENPDGGAVANVGSTRFDFPGTGVNYQNEFYRLLFTVGVPSLGEAFAGSKLPFVVDSSHDSEDRWTQFSQILLGDPSLRIWRAEPMTAAVSHPAALTLGGGPVTVTVTAGGGPLEGATVCLYKAGDDYETAVTDAAGQATLTFRPDRPGTARLTVTDLLIRPYQADLTVGAPATPHLFASLALVDDSTAPAQANGNGLFELYETVNYNLVMRNEGSATATGVTATLVSADPNLLVIDGSAAWPNLAPGASASPSNGFVLKAVGTATDRYETSATLNITAAGYSRSEPVVVLVGAPSLERYQLVYSDAVTGNGNGIFEPNEDHLLTLTIRNNGRGAIRGLVGKLRPLDAQTTITDSVSTYGDVNSGATAAGDGFVFRYSDANLFRKMRFVLEIPGQTVMSYDIDLSKPGTPVLPAAGGKATSIAITWSPVIDLDMRGYILYRSSSVGGPFTRINTYADAKIAYYNDDNLPPLTRFYYKISAIDLSGNESPQSAVAAATTTLPLAAGFPLALGGAASSSPAFSYFDGDTIPEIVAGSDELYVISGLGKEYVDGDGDARTYGVFSSSGYANFWSPPSSTDIDRDGAIDVAAAGWVNGRLYLFDGHAGPKPGFPVNIDVANNGNAHTWSAPVMVDVDGDSTMEIFVNSAAHTYAFHADGTELIDGDANPATIGVFAALGSASNYATPRVADLDNDGTPEVIIGSRDRKLYVKRLNGTNYPGFPVTYTADITSSPAIGDLNNDGLKEIVFGCSDNKLYAYNINKVAPSGWPKGVNFNQDLDSSPALADVNGDGFLDVAICAGNGTVYIFQGQDGAIFAGYPVILYDSSGSKIQIRSSPAIGNVDSSPDLEIIFGGQDGNVYALKSNGQMALGFPIRTENVVEGGPLVWDLDGDGLTEVCVQSFDQNLYVWDTPAPFTPQSCPWPMFGHDSRRTGVYGAPIFIVTGTPEPAAPRPPAAQLAQNVPNPFAPGTSIRFNLASAAREMTVRLDVFDLQGRAVRHLYEARLTGGDYEVSWDGRTDLGTPVGSGVYFYRLEVDGFAVTRRMIVAR